MTTVEFIDPSDSAAFAAFHQAYVQSWDRPFDHPWNAAEMLVHLTPDEYREKRAAVVRDAGVVVAGATLGLPLKDNTTFAYVEVFTVPAHRRKGHASEVLAGLAAEAQGRGRSMLLGEAAWDVGADGGPGKSFAEARGFTIDILDAQRELLLPADLPPLGVADGYTLHSWRGPCPEEWVESYAALRRLMEQEAPSGDAGLENEFWDAGRVRKDEDDAVRSNRLMQVTVARFASGELAGHTQLSFPIDSVEVYQWDTLVLPEHRGHGLGLALKVHTMHEASDLLEGRRRIHTYNAASNAHMIAVNDLLGFRQIAWLGEYVRKI